MEIFPLTPLQSSSRSCLQLFQLSILEFFWCFGDSSCIILKNLRLIGHHRPTIPSPPLKKKINKKEGMLFSGKAHSDIIWWSDCVFCLNGSSRLNGSRGKISRYNGRQRVRIGPKRRGDSLIAVGHWKRRSASLKVCLATRLSHLLQMERSKVV